MLAETGYNGFLAHLLWPLALTRRLGGVCSRTVAIQHWRRRQVLLQLVLGLGWRHRLRCCERCPQGSKIFLLAFSGLLQFLQSHLQATRQESMTHSTDAFHLFVSRAGTQFQVCASLRAASVGGTGCADASAALLAADLPLVLWRPSSAPPEPPAGKSLVLTVLMVSLHLRVSEIVDSARCCSSFCLISAGVIGCTAARAALKTARLSSWPLSAISVCLEPSASQA